MKVGFFDLVPEIKPPIFYLMLALIIIVAILLAVLPSVFGFPYLIAVVIYCLLTFLLWTRGYGLAKKEGDAVRNYRSALFFCFFPAMCLWYAALIMPFLSEGLKIIINVNLFVFVLSAVIVFFMWLRTVKVFSREELFVVGSFFSVTELNKKSVFAYIRHPFLSIALFTAFSFFSLSPGLYSGFCLATVFLTAYFWSRKEESELIQRFGDEYISYKKATGRFVPKPNKIKGFMQLIFWDKYD